MAEAYVGSRVVFGASVCRLAGAQKPDIVSGASSVVRRLIGLGPLLQLSRGLRETEQSLRLQGLYKVHN